jgi:hypothetical protein
MRRVWLGLILSTLLLAGLASRLSAQGTIAAGHPLLAGTWTPIDPKQCDTFYRVGLFVIPGSGHLTIEQRPDRFTVTFAMPDDALLASPADFGALERPEPAGGHRPGSTYARADCGRHVGDRWPPERCRLAGRIAEHQGGIRPRTRLEHESSRGTWF